MINKICKKTICLIVLALVLCVNAQTPIFAAEEAADVAPTISTIADSPATAAATDTAATPTPSPALDYAKAVAAAEKMYYCGELYVFTVSMIQTNYDMAALAANLKEFIGARRGASDRKTLTDMISQYNFISHAYNSWVDVRPDLERYIDAINNSRVYHIQHLQQVFRNTLITINAVRPLLELANEYIENPSGELQSALNKDIDATIRKAANANRVMAPFVTRSLKGYRSYFDEFSSYAGIEHNMEDDDR